MRLVALMIVTTLMTSSAADAQNNVKVKTICQKNLREGRILVKDGRILPDNARFRIVAYKPTSRDGIWSSGSCVVVVKKR